MEAETNTLKEIRIHQEILELVSGRLPIPFINCVFNHMKDNKEDQHDHTYLRNSLKVVNRIIKLGSFNDHDQSLCYALASLLEAGRPLTRDYPYDVVPGVAWMFLRRYASDMFDADDIRFISQSCKPIIPMTLRASVFTKVLLACHDAKCLADVVGQNHRKLYLDHLAGECSNASSALLDKRFLDYYGENGNLWVLISDSSMDLFEPEINLFKRNLSKVISDYT